MRIDDVAILEIPRDPSPRTLRWFGPLLGLVLSVVAGLVRAFKGKGIKLACLTGLWAARAIMMVGTSARAFERSYVRDSREILRDIPYGHLVRQLVINASRLGQVDLALALAEDHPALRQALFDAVSGHQPYRFIIRELLRAPFDGLP